MTVPKMPEPVPVVIDAMGELHLTQVASATCARPACPLERQSSAFGQCLTFFPVIIVIREPIGVLFHTYTQYAIALACAA